jgi:hypothetical protein
LSCRASIGGRRVVATKVHWGASASHGRVPARNVARSDIASIHVPSLILVESGLGVVSRELVIEGSVVASGVLSLASVVVVPALVATSSMLITESWTHSWAVTSTRVHDSAWCDGSGRLHLLSRVNHRRRVDSAHPYAYLPELEDVDDEGIEVDVGIRVVEQS